MNARLPNGGKGFPALMMDRDVEELIRPELLGFEEYSALVPLDVLSQRAGIPVEKLIKLNGNENPYGCSPEVRHALANYPFYHFCCQ